MNITLERSLFSIVHCLTEGFDTEKTMIIFDEMPEDFTVPAIYFPTPISRSRKETFGSYRTTLTMRVMYFEADDWSAYERAATARDDLILMDCRIPLVDDDGAELEVGYVRIREVETGKDENSVHYLQFELPVYFGGEDPDGQTVETFDIHVKAMSAEGARSAWIAATQELREEQEEKEAWLRTTLSRMRL